MHQPFVERHGYLDGPLQRWDPRLKLAGLLTLLVILTVPGMQSGPPAWTRLCGAALVLAAGLWHSRLPCGRFLLHSLLPLPFVLFLALAQALAVAPVEGGPLRIGPTHYGLVVPEDGPERALLLVARTWLCVSATLLVMATTALPRLLAALEWSRAPRAFVQVLGHLYRYLWVLLDETRHVLLARRLRSFRRRAWLERRAVAGTIATLFVRTLERARLVHQAMLQRGYQGRLPLLERLAWQRSDSRHGVLLAVLLAGIALVPHWVSAA